MATAARGTVVIGAGLAFGLLTAHMQSSWASAQADGVGPAAPAVTAKAKPKVVTIVRKKHVPSDPIIVYRQVPVGGGAAPTGSGGSYSSGGGSGSGSSTSSGSSGGGTVAPAPAPRPAANPAPPASTSKSS